MLMVRSLAVVVLGAVAAAGARDRGSGAVGNIGACQAPQVHGQGGEGVARALLVGINDYQSQDVNRLRGCINDVEAMRALLMKRFGYMEQDIVLLTNERATRQGILAAIDQLVQICAGEDTVLIYYAGHGSQVKDLNGDEPDGLDETLVPYDGRMPGVPDIVDDELNTSLNRFRCRDVIVVLDSCHSGTASRGDYATRCVPADKRADLYATLPGQRDVVDLDYQRLLFFSATAADQSALDGRAEKDGEYRGFFSYAFTKAVSALATDASPRQIFERVADELRVLGERKRIPRMPEPTLESRQERLSAPMFRAIQARGGDTPEIAVRIVASDGEDRVLKREMAGLTAGLRKALPGLRFVDQAEASADFWIRVSRREAVLCASDSTELEKWGAPADGRGGWLGALATTIGTRLVSEHNRLLAGSFENEASGLSLEVQLCGGELNRTQSTPKGIRVSANLSQRMFRMKPEDGGRDTGNSVQLSIRCSSDCFLTIVDIDANDGITVLFPNTRQAAGFLPGGRVDGGKWVSIPDSLADDNEADFYWDVGPPAGTDTILVMAAADKATAEGFRAALAEISPADLKVLSSGDEDSRRVAMGRAGAVLQSTLEWARLRGLGVEGKKKKESMGGPADATSDTAASAGDWTARTLTFVTK